jgi:hypothetical protein
VHLAPVDLKKLFDFILHVMYCACMCRVLLIDGDRLDGSTLPYIILVRCIIFMTRTAMRN